jgi:hypothetical protein
MWPADTLISVFDFSLEQSILLKYAEFLTYGNHELIDFCALSDQVCYKVIEN